MASEGVRVESEWSDIHQLRDEIAQQKFYLENMQKDLKDRELRLKAILKRPVMA
jgi:hypothetical protein